MWEIETDFEKKRKKETNIFQSILLIFWIFFALSWCISVKYIPVYLPVNSNLGVTSNS